MATDAAEGAVSRRHETSQLGPRQPWAERLEPLAPSAPPAVMMAGMNATSRLAKFVECACIAGVLFVLAGVTLSLGYAAALAARVWFGRQRDASR